MTNEGRIFCGTLKSFDQRMNLILSDCEEHVYSGEQVPMSPVPMGAYLIRGDNIAVVGEVVASQLGPVCGAAVPAIAN